MKQQITNKKEEGITLIALVVTVVVLLILAAISINIAFGNNGIFKQAQKAASSTANAIDYEANTLGQQMEEFIENSLGLTSTQEPTEPQEPEPTETYYLVDKVSIGDYVAYDTGTWSSTVASPTSSASFGGYTSGTNKGTSVNTYDDSYKASTSGWRVFSKSGSGSTGTIALISAGSPALGYYADWDPETDAARLEMISSLNSFANKNFVNSSYARSARNASYNDLYGESSTSIFRVINSYFWLASEYPPGDGGYHLYVVYPDGVAHGGRNKCYRCSPDCLSKSRS